MTIKIYDTMTRSLREFVPITENTVNMYVCGPTVYNYIHIGNARSVVAFDTIRRYFEYRGYKVNYISNFTVIIFLTLPMLMIRLSKVLLKLAWIPKHSQINSSLHLWKMLKSLV